MILLHTTKYGDSGVILHGYTCEGGRESFLLRGVGKNRTISIGCLHPLSILEANCPSLQKGSLKYIKEFSPKYPLNSIREDHNKSAIVFFVSEVLYKTLREGEADPKMYSFLHNAILTLNELPSNYANFHLWFLAQYASELGYKPKEPFFDNFNPFTKGEIELLGKFLNDPFADTMCIPLKGEQRTAFATNLTKYLEYHLGFIFETKSLKILHQLCH